MPAQPCRHFLFLSLAILLLSEVLQKAAALRKPVKRCLAERLEKHLAGAPDSEKTL